MLQICLVLVLFCFCPFLQTAEASSTFKVNTLLNRDDVIWGIDILPSEDLIFTERNGKIMIFNETTMAVKELSGVPVVATGGQGGLLDILVHPDPAKSFWIYFSYAVALPNGRSTRVARAQIKDNSLTNLEILFTASPAKGGGLHFGSRLQIDKAGYLFVTVGERGERDEAQNLGSHLGKVIRLHDDGRVPRDNPFAKLDKALPEIWSYGHRNPQGLRLHPETGELWLHEHGPRGGDELNLIKKGANYGWPKVSHGREYYGPKISDQSSAPGFEDPRLVYVPSIAPSGLDFLRGDAYIGALVLRHLNQVSMSESKISEKARLLSDLKERIRAVRVSPKGKIYLGTDSGKLLRLDPQ